MKLMMQNKMINHLKRNKLKKRKSMIKRTNNNSDYNTFFYLSKYSCSGKLQNRSNEYELCTYVYKFYNIQTQQMLENKLLGSTGLANEQYEKTLATHKNFLVKFKTLPDKTRKATYKQLLMLPNNYGHLQQLTKPYPVLPEHGFNRQLAIVVDMLGRLYPDLKNQWVPSLVHPFVKLFQEDFTFSFQSSLCFIINWFEPILLDFPNPNKQIMQIFQETLPDLKQRIQSFDYPLSSLVNPIFVVSLTDILNRKDWLQVFDFLVTHPFQPWHYISVAIAIISMTESQLQKLKSVQQMSLALRKQKNIPVQKIIKKSLQISNIFRHRFLQIYKNSVFPIQENRYPVHKFYRTEIRKTNSKLDYEDDIEMSEIKTKYQKLQAMLQNFINTNHASDEEAIESKYEMVEGQVRQYLNLIKQQHANKMNALREVESKFNSQLQNYGKQRQSKMSAIDKRARLQREIDTVLAEAESIKQMEDQMMKRVSESLKIKKKQIKKISEGLRNK